MKDAKRNDQGKTVPSHADGYDPYGNSGGDGGSGDDPYGDSGDGGGTGSGPYGDQSGGGSTGDDAPPISIPDNRCSVAAYPPFALEGTTLSLSAVSYMTVWIPWYPRPQDGDTYLFEWSESRPDGKHVLYSRQEAFSGRFPESLLVDHTEFDTGTRYTALLSYMIVPANPYDFRRLSADLPLQVVA